MKKKSHHFKQYIILEWVWPLWLIIWGRLLSVIFKATLCDFWRKIRHSSSNKWKAKFMANKTRPWLFQYSQGRAGISQRPWPSASLLSVCYLDTSVFCWESEFLSGNIKWNAAHITSAGFDFEPGMNRGRTGLFITTVWHKSSPGQPGDWIQLILMCQCCKSCDWVNLWEEKVNWAEVRKFDKLMNEYDKKLNM